MDALRRASDLCLNPVVVAEILAGAMKTGGSYDKSLQEFLKSPRTRVLAIDEDTGRYYATIADSLRRDGRPIPTNDVWIAASAMQHGLVVLTADGHFTRVKQIITEVIPQPRSASPGR